MQKIQYLIIVLIFTGCIHHSNITSTKIKKSVILQSQQDTIPIRNANSILSNIVDLETLKYLNGNKDRGSLSIFLTKENTYVEARSNYITIDSISFSGVILYNGKSDTLHFTISFRPSSNSISFIRLSEGNYTVKILPSNIDNNGDTSGYFNLRKFQNFIIREDVLDLITGELQKENGNISKFLILNDVIKPDYWLTPLWIVDLISEPEYKYYVQKCRVRELNKIIPICKTGYDLDWEFNWLKYNLVCKCYEE